MGFRKGRIKRFADALVLTLTVVCVAALLCSYLAPHVSPARSWVPAFMGLVAPVLIVSNILLALYWIMRWRWVALLPMVALLLGVNYFSLFFRPALSRNLRREAPGSVRVMTYNVMGFTHITPGGKYAWQPDSVLVSIREARPDILCLQEFSYWNDRQRERLDSLIDLPHKEVFSPSGKPDRVQGLAVYSRYPILRSGNMAFRGSTSKMMWVDVATGRDTLRVFCNHLQTTSVNTDERGYIDSRDFISELSPGNEVVRGIASKMRRNFVIRATYADSIAAVTEASPHAAIVCGDFNDTPLSYTYFRMRGPMRDAFAQKGRGIASNTFRGLFNLFRIDYVLHSPTLKTVSYNTVSNDYSDHKAVVADLLPPSRATNRPASVAK